MKLTRGTGHDTGRGLAICDGAEIVARVVGEGYPVGIGNGPRSDALANLLCAAPELLAACKRLVAAWDANFGDDRFGPDAPARNSAIEAARAAIIAAELGSIA